MSNNTNNNSKAVKTNEEFLNFLKQSTEKATPCTTPTPCHITYLKDVIPGDRGYNSQRPEVWIRVHTATEKFDIIIGLSQFRNTVIYVVQNITGRSYTESAQILHNISTYNKWIINTCIPTALESGITYHYGYRTDDQEQKYQGHNLERTNS